MEIPPLVCLNPCGEKFFPYNNKFIYSIFQDGNVK